MFFDRKTIQVDVYINYGDDEIRHERVKAPPGSTVLDVLRGVAEVKFGDDSATGHLGSMVTAIDGHSNDLKRCWIYYVFEPGQSGWRIPLEMPDLLEVSDGMRIGWRYCDYSRERDKVVRDGPLFTARCAGKVRTCARQF